MPGTLFITATPIGNLSDITLRALEILKFADYILCEDTRVTKNLLDHYKINRPLISYHHHSDARKINEIKKLLEDGKNLALVTDAGTPGISDPGNQLIEHLALNIEHITIVPIPGASAVTAALSICGFPTDKFLFLGFPPHKKGRRTFFQNIGSAEYTAVFYESGHRIAKCLRDLSAVLKPAAKVVICRELTKKFETIYRLTAAKLNELKIDERGEFTIIIEP